MMLAAYCIVDGLSVLVMRFAKPEGFYLLCCRGFRDERRGDVVDEREAGRRFY